MIAPETETVPEYIQSGDSQDSVRSDERSYAVKAGKEGGGV